MDPTIMRMIVKAEQDQKLRRGRRQRDYNTELSRNYSSEWKKMAYHVALSGLLGLFVLLVAWIVMAV